MLLDIIFSRFFIVKNNVGSSILHVQNNSKLALLSDIICQCTKSFFLAKEMETKRSFFACDAFRSVIPSAAYDCEKI